MTAWSKRRTVCCVCRACRRWHPPSVRSTARGLYEPRTLTRCRKSAGTGTRCGSSLGCHRMGSASLVMVTSAVGRPVVAHGRCFWACLQLCGRCVRRSKWFSSTSFTRVRCGMIIHLSSLVERRVSRCCGCGYFVLCVRLCRSAQTVKLWV